MEVIPLQSGSEAPDFTLNHVITGEPVTLSALRDQVVILNFWSLECPWSRKFDEYFLTRAPEWEALGVWLLFIDSNDNEAIYDIQDLVEELGIPNPVLRDSGNVVADQYGALTTPHVFVIAGSGTIVYQGAIDDRSFRQQEATVNYLDAALEALMSSRKPDPSDTLAYGCTIVRHFDD
jgi:peroxiredoxin